MQNLSNNTTFTLKSNYVQFYITSGVCELNTVLSYRMVQNIKLQTRSSPNIDGFYFTDLYFTRYSDAVKKVIYLVNTNTNFPRNMPVKKMKIVQNLAKIWTKMCGLLFWPPCSWKDVGLHSITKMYVRDFEYIFKQNSQCCLRQFCLFSKSYTTAFLSKRQRIPCQLRNNYFRLPVAILDIRLPVVSGSISTYLKQTY